MKRLWIVDCGLWKGGWKPNLQGPKSPSAVGWWIASPQSTIHNPKSVAVLALTLAGSALASAQFLPGTLSGLDTLRQNGKLGTGPARDPLQPRGFPNPDEKRPDEQVDAQRFQFINSDEPVEINGTNNTLKGNVEFLARGYHVRCDEAQYNTRTEIAVLTGHVLILGNGANVYGDGVTVDFQSGTYIARRAETQLSPEQTAVGLTGPLYVSGKLSSGNQLLTHTQDGLVTTCNLDDPHYRILARDIDYRAGKRVVLRDAKLVILGHTIVQVPYLSIPLDDRTTRYSPYVGYTDDEGYFIKNTFGIALPGHGDQVLYAHTDYMTKKGLGLGADYGYTEPTLAGVAKVYKIFGPGDATTFSNDHRQAFRWGSASLANDYQQNNYLTASNQTILNTRGAVTYNDFLGPHAVDRLNLTRSSTSTDAYSSVSQTLALTDQRQFGTKIRTDTGITYLDSQNKSSTSTADTEAQRMQLKFLSTDDLGPGVASLNYQRSIPVGETKQYLGSSDLTPVFAFDTDSRRVFGNDIGRDVPLKTTLSWGQYADPRTQSQVERYGLLLGYAKSSPVEGIPLTFDTAANFRQTLYSDDTAQYTLGLNENGRYRLGRDTGINLRYSYLQPYGYTPIALDTTGKTNVVTTDINDRPIPQVLLGVQTGYDINREKDGQIAWQQVGIRSEWTPAANTLIRGLYTYDTYQQAFSSLRFDATTFHGDFRGSLNAQYDGIRHTWSTFNGTFDGIRVGRTKIAALFAYNGYLKKFESQQIALTYDLHCAEAVLAVQENDTGFRPGRQIFLLIRLKAVPFDLPFGTGTRGQPVGIGNGTSF